MPRNPHAGSPNYSSKMITFPCDKCNKLLETDDDTAGTKVECPHCGDVNVVPAAGARSSPAARAKARPAAPDRAQAMGLPPDSGPEQTVLKVHPAMVRAHPLAGMGLLLCLAIGIIGAAVSFATMPPAAIAFGALALAGVVWFCVWKIKSWTTTLIITTKRTTLRRGILSRSQREVLHDRVQDVQVNQSFIDRMLGVGSLGLSTSSDEGVEITVYDVPNVLHVRNVIDAYRDM